MASSGLPPTQREAAVQQSGGPGAPRTVTAGRELSLNGVLKLNLHNRGNLCYINCSILTAAWSVLQLHRHGVASLNLHPCYHALASGTTKPTSIQVTQLMQWRLLLGQWPQLGRQHDVCEFLTCLVPRCIRWLGDSVAPTWEARRFRNGRLCTLDSGPALLPIPLPLCSGEVCHLQWCVDEVHKQGSVHALTHPAPLLCLQLLRFHNEVGEVQRDSRPRKGHMTTIHVPVFQDDCEATRNELQCTQKSRIRSCPWSCTLGHRQLKGTIMPFSVANPSLGETKDGLLMTIVQCGLTPAQNPKCSVCDLATP